MTVLPPPMSLTLASLQKGKTSVVSTMMSLGSFFALLTMIGMIPRMLHFPVCNQNCPNMLFSVRAKLRDAEPGYDFMSNFFL